MLPTLLTFVAFVLLRKLPSILAKKSFCDEEVGDIPAAELFVRGGVDVGNDDGQKFCFKSFNLEVLVEIEEGCVF